MYRNKGDSMKFKKRNDYELFWLYIGLFSNLTIDQQTEYRLLSYKQFKRIKDKSSLIDLYRQILYNNQKKIRGDT